jgi:hypothetical protein
VIYSICNLRPEFIDNTQTQNIFSKIILNCYTQIRVEVLVQSLITASLGPYSKLLQLSDHWIKQHQTFPLITKTINNNSYLKSFACKLLKNVIYISIHLSSTQSCATHKSVVTLVSDIYSQQPYSFLSLIVFNLWKSSVMSTNTITTAKTVNTDLTVKVKHSLVYRHSLSTKKLMIYDWNLTAP